MKFVNIVRNSSGSVGIGTSEPSARLYVSGSYSASETTALFKAGFPSPLGGVGVLDVQDSSGNSLLFVSGSGRVGVNSSSPTNTLDVRGSLGIGGTTTYGNGLTVTSTNSSAANHTHYVRGPAAGTNDDIYFDLNRGGGAYGSFNVNFNSSLIMGIGGGALRYNGNILLQPVSNLQLASGKFSIGGATPVARFEITGSGATSSTTTMHLVNSSNTSLMFVRDDGNVGVGTSSPATKLSVYSGAVSANYGVFSGSLAAYVSAGALYTYWNTTSNYGTIVSVADGSGTAAPMQLRVGTSLAAHIDSSGNVGIGTASVSGKLHVYNASTATQYIGTVNHTLRLSADDSLGGVEISNAASTPIIFKMGAPGNEIGRFLPGGTWAATGSFEPGTDNTYDLGSSTKRWRNLYVNSVSGSLTGSNLTAGQIVVVGTGGVLSGSNKLYWYNANNWVGIGTNSPASQVDLYGTSGGRVQLGFDSPAFGVTIQAAATPWARYYSFQNSSNTILGSFGGYGGSNSLTYLFIGAAYDNTALRADQTTGNVTIGNASGTGRLYVTGSSTATTPTMVVREGVVTPQGGAGILDVQKSDGTTVLFVSGSGAVGIGNSSLTYPNAQGMKLDIRTGNIGLPQFGGMYIGDGSSFYRRLIGQDVGTVLRVGADTAQFAALTLSSQGSFDLLALSSGNVGIGSTSPGARLLVSGSATAATPTMVVREGVVTPQGGAGTFDVQNSSGTSLLFVSGSGNVGIGTTVSQVPSHRLHIAGKIGGGLFVDSSLEFLSSGNTELKANTDLKLGYALSTVIRSSGNVGVGTLTPTSRLHVYGSSTSTTPTAIIQEGATPTGGAGAFDVQNVGGTSILFVTGSGHVGIGTNIPYAYSGYTVLNIGNSSATGLIKLRSSYNSGDGTEIYQSSTGKTFFNANSLTTAFTYDASGNVGIGTSLADSKLVVNGNSVFSGSVNPDGDLTRDLGAPTKRWKNLYAANISGSLTGSNVSAGQVVVAGTGGVLSGSNNLFWLNTSNRLGIGTSNPTYPLEVNNSGGTDLIKATNSVGSYLLTNYDFYAPSSFRISAGGTGYLNLASGAGSTNCTISLTTNSTTRLLIDSTGNVGIGTGLNLTSRFLVTGSGSGTGSTAHFVNSSGTSLLFVRDDGNVGIGDSNPASGLSLQRGSAGSTVAVLLNAGGFGLRIKPQTGTNFDTFLFTASGESLSFGTSNTERARIDATSGNVAIGTTSTSSRLLISGSSTATTATLTVREGVPANTFNVALMNVQDYVGNNLLFVTGSGNVGIGTIPSSARLHITTPTVAGSGNFAFAIEGTGTGAQTWKLYPSTSTTLVLLRSGLRLAAFGNDGSFYAGGISGDAGAGAPFTVDGTSDNVAVGVAGTSLTAARFYVTGSSTATTPTMIVREGVASPLDGANVFSVQNWVASTLFSVSGSGYIGIGVSNPTYDVDMIKTTAGSVVHRIRNSSASASAEATLLLNASGNSWGISMGSAAMNNNSLTLVQDYVSSKIERVRFDTSGNVGIGTNSFSDRLAVNGTMSVTGSYLNPGVDNSTKLGDTNKRWSNIYGTNILGNFLPTSMTPGSVLYINSSGAIAQDNANLFWNDSTKRLGIGTASPGFRLEVNGDFAATTKSFVIPHPLKPGWKLRYGSLEGPENGVYCRGQSESEVIDLPDYWVPLVDEASITVQITPVGKWQSLYVESVENNQIKIGRGWFMRLFRIKPKYFYTVSAARKDSTFEVEYSPLG